jgi:hypothetical protein
MNFDGLEWFMSVYMKDVPFGELSLDLAFIAATELLLIDHNYTHEKKHIALALINEVTDLQNELQQEFALLGWRQVNALGNAVEKRAFHEAVLKHNNQELYSALFSLEVSGIKKAML